MPSRTLADVEREVADVPLFKLLQQYRTCALGEHRWEPLDAPQLSALGAEWCDCCLRVRTRSFEGWLTCLPGQE